jgi:hypothetical protein
MPVSATSSASYLLPVDTARAVTRGVSSTAASMVHSTDAMRDTAAAATSAVGSAATVQRPDVDPADSAGVRQRVAGDLLAQHHRTAASSATPASTTAAVDLPSGYGALEKLSSQLQRLDPRFSTATTEGRATLAIALAIGGTEAFGKGRPGNELFSLRGGTGDRMRGFAQYNIAFHDKATRTPERYAAFTADILTGQRPMPNSEPGRNHAAALARAVQTGQVHDEATLQRFLRGRGFGGSNWQGIDDGWHRSPGLGDALIRFVAGGTV